MRCEQIRELLSPYIDRMTDEKENKIIEAHLTYCPECRQELEGLKLMCGFLGDLEHPVIPDRFSEDLHKRLLEEKTGFLVAKDVKRPKRSGWIAAGVAGLAIAVGVYASSILPLGTIVASLQDKSDDQSEKPKVAIEEIIRSIKGWNTEKNVVTPDIDIADNEADVNKPSQTSDKPDNNTPNTQETESNQEPNEPVDVSPKFTDEYSTQVKVADLMQATNQVIQLAEASGAEYVVSNGTAVQILSKANVKGKEISLTVEPGKAEALLKQLGGLGKISPSVHNQIELTQEYADLEEQISTTDKLIKDLEAKNSEANNKQLEELKGHLNNCNDQKAQLEKQVNTVTLKVYLEEEVDH